jgi:pyrroline-5-carboxylate reductase
MIIGFVGAGNMATALIQGLLAAKVALASNILAADIDDARLSRLRNAYGITIAEDNLALVKRADVVILAVKPQVLDSLLSEIGPHVPAESLVVSIAAGVPLAALESRFLPGARLVRAMPNTAATVLTSATALAAGTHATQADLDAVKVLFEAVGKVVLVNDADLDAVTGLSGSGPAYVLVMIEALADAGVRAGLQRPTALLLAAQTVYGTAKLVLETGEHPARLKDLVTSPGGTTLAGLYALEAGGLRKAVMDAVDAATKRSAELAKVASTRLHRS